MPGSRARASIHPTPSASVWTFIKLDALSSAKRAALPPERGGENRADPNPDRVRISLAGQAWAVRVIQRSKKK